MFQLNMNGIFGLDENCPCIQKHALFVTCTICKKRDTTQNGSSDPYKSTRQARLSIKHQLQNVFMDFQRNSTQYFFTTWLRFIVQDYDSNCSLE